LLHPNRRTAAKQPKATVHFASQTSGAFGALITPGREAV
jgi:hypothetical protein